MKAACELKCGTAASPTDHTEALARVQEFVAVRDGFGGDKIKRAAHAAVHGHYVSDRYSPCPGAHVTCEFEGSEHQISTDIADGVTGGGRARVPLVQARAAVMRLAAQEALQVAGTIRSPVPDHISHLNTINHTDGETSVYSVSSRTRPPLT